MPALDPRRRLLSARELARRLDVSEATITRLWAEPRQDFEDRARQRAQRVAELRRDGWTYRMIADELELSPGAVAGLVHQARRYGYVTEPVRQGRRTKAELAALVEARRSGSDDAEPRSAVG